MEAKKKRQKALQPTMVIKAEKNKNYVYQLRNGDILEFESKEFPTEQKKQNSNNQITLQL